MEPSIANRYSENWFRYFHEGMPAERSIEEVRAVEAICPPDRFPRVLDVCCGLGRHCRAFADRGYWVTGIERDAGMVNEARRLGGGPEYLAMDVRDFAVSPEAGTFDLVVIFGQSFGYFDDKENAALLTRLAESLRIGGRLLLDLWQPEFFEKRPGRRELIMRAGTVLETKSMVGSRLRVQLEYPDGGAEWFEWQVFTQDEMASFAARAGLRLMRVFQDFDPAAVPHPDKPKVQFLLERMLRE